MTPIKAFIEKHPASQGLAGEASLTGFVAGSSPSTSSHSPRNVLLGAALWVVVAVVARVTRGELARRPVQRAVEHVA